MQTSGSRRARLIPGTARVYLRGTAISAATRPETRLPRLAARAPRLPVEAAQHSAIGYVLWLAIEVRPIRTRPPQHEIGRAQGLEKLRYIEDRKLAQLALEFHFNIESRRRTSR